MNKVMESSYDEYIEWFLEREKREKPEQNPSKVPRLARNRRKLMEKEHRDKTRPWYKSAGWSIVTITQDEFERIIPIESDWTKEVGLTDWSLGVDYRLLRNVAHIAIRKIGNEEYFIEDNKAEMRGYERYYNALKHGDRRLKDKDRIVLHSLDDNERLGNPQGKPPGNPCGFFYLQDGWGRSLPYQILLMEGYVAYEPVEAFLVCRRDWRRTCDTWPNG